MKKRPSLKDIAKKLNVSVTTVSFVLNGKGKEKKISDELIKKVIDYTDSINYRPNKVAQSLRTGKTNILVFMVEDISNYFFSKIARIMEDIAYDKGYKVLFCSNENEDERSKELIQLFSERQVDGFIISPSPGIQNEIESLIENKIPVVLFDRYFEDLDVSHVIIDNEDASSKATKHLIDNDFSRIGFITIESSQNQMTNREKGYVDAMKSAGLEPLILKIPFEKIHKEETKLEIRKFIIEGQELDSVFFSTNYLTRTALEVIKETDQTLLEKLGVVTFDDNELFRINTPTITAVSQPLQELGESLMNTMLNLLNSKAENLKPTKSVLKASLIVRNSSINKN
ncbi:LacI family DNA-binding transcriptional regulator [Christiangramia sp. SM2212]|uniref:LacI family DNA-binding transcriptional regulator n=1 Tax=Christiangramia sediminicola TaxID=3073267 RepID=A0ABU1ELG6_9FLAO|nr:LacI family DNA-binding transcriptional regulator [Christiangramia sp. SM2212]MDR5589028.1 LacI family DNA-binding transcriptional regulator [Christiangramia sp. SM2212]